MQAAPIAVLLLLGAAGALASEGDAALEYRQCHGNCLRTGCAAAQGSKTCDIVCPGVNSYRPPVALLLTKWDCPSDCSYHCMWAIETPKAAARSGPVYKYHGKWPFIRVLGAQEIASVVFSLANLAAHMHNLLLYFRTAAALRVTQQQYPYILLWPVYSLASINAWVWSSVFHVRDTRVTEKFDYFSADLLVAVGFFTALARVLGLRAAGAQLLLGLLVAAGLLQHIYFMAFVKFDYGYNMKVCIAVGVFTALLWLAWVSYAKHPGRKLVYLFLGLVHVAMLLEVLDFPPLLWLFDAHALWHAATAPLTYLWYRFVAADMQWLVAGGKGRPPGVQQQSAAMAGHSPPGKHKNGD